jgi:hypothetical protein
MYVVDRGFHAICVYLVGTRLQMYVAERGLSVYLVVTMLMLVVFKEPLHGITFMAL